MMNQRPQTVDGPPLGLVRKKHTIHQPRGTWRRAHEGSWTHNCWYFSCHYKLCGNLGKTIFDSTESLLLLVRPRSMLLVILSLVKLVMISYSSWRVDQWRVIFFKMAMTSWRVTSLFLGARHDELISDDLVFSSSSKNDELTSQTCQEEVFLFGPKCPITIR